MTRFVSQLCTGAGRIAASYRRMTRAGLENPTSASDDCHSRLGRDDLIQSRKERTADAARFGCKSVIFPRRPAPGLRPGFKSTGGEKANARQKMVVLRKRHAGVTPDDQSAEAVAA